MHACVAIHIYIYPINLYISCIYVTNEVNSIFGWDTWVELVSHYWYFSLIFCIWYTTDISISRITMQFSPNKIFKDYRIFAIKNLQLCNVSYQSLLSTPKLKFWRRTNLVVDLLQITHPAKDAYLRFVLGLTFFHFVFVSVTSTMTMMIVLNYKHFYLLPLKRSTKVDTVAFACFVLRFQL